MSHFSMSPFSKLVGFRSISFEEFAGCWRYRSVWESECLFVDLSAFTERQSSFRVEMTEVALITGCATGIGRALALDMHARTLPDGSPAFRVYATDYR